ncbi:hypothetical protein GQ53DRAFT_808084, partial [Thozetella sp. PMI_491]
METSIVKNYHIKKDVLLQWVQWRFRNWDPGYLGLIKVKADSLMKSDLRAIKKQLARKDNWDPPEEFPDVFPQYPGTMLRRPRPHEFQQWEAHHVALREKEKLLFDASEPEVEFWETGSASNKFAQHLRTSTEGVTEHLVRAANDPMIRHIFLQSDDSRSPVNCSPDMLKFVLTYHQIDPFFLDSFTAFVEQYEPVDQSLMSFRGTDTLKCPDDRVIALPQVGRSGREFHTSYLLRSIEYISDMDWNWAVRQTAVYTSFDVETGRSVWFNIKSNDLFKSRIKKSSEYLDLPSRPVGSNVPAYFEASLLTHLVYLAWCDENWRKFNNDVENGIRDILDRARTTPIDDHLDERQVENGAYPKSLRGSTRVNFMPSRTDIMSSKSLAKQSTLERLTGATRKLMDAFASRRAHGERDLEKAADVHDELDHVSIASLDGAEIMHTLDKFRIKDMQTLRTFGDRIQRAILTLQLNISVLEDIHRYYRSLFTSDTAAMMDLKSRSEEAMAMFLSEVYSITQSLSSRKSQLEYLAEQLKEGNQLYGDILQYRSLHIGQFFMESAQETAKQTKII